MDKIKNQSTNFIMGLVFLLVNITSVIVVTQITHLNLPFAFLMTGVNTILFHIITKHKLPSVLGTSGLYISGILLISEKYGVEYAMGGVVLTGVLYIIFAIIMLKYQNKFLKLIPDYLLSTIILLIALGLMPIGANLVNKNLLIGLSSMATMLIIELFVKNNKIRLFSMPIGILAGALVQLFTNGLDLTPMQQTLSMQIVTPKFNLESFLTISLVAFAVVFESLGDIKNTSSISNIDAFKEVGLPRIFLANGIATILNGFTGVNPATTFSEQNSAIQITGYRDTFAQIFMGIFFIIIAFITPISKFILCISVSAFGGVLLFLFASVASSSIKQIIASGVNLETNKKAFIIITTMIALFFVNFSIGVVGISSIAIATFVGIILNATVKID